MRYPIITHCYLGFRPWKRAGEFLVENVGVEKTKSNRAKKGVAFAKSGEFVVGSVLICISAITR